MDVRMPALKPGFNTSGRRWDVFKGKRNRGPDLCSVLCVVAPLLDAHHVLQATNT